MALSDTGKAIGAVTSLLRTRLSAAPGVSAGEVSVGRPEPRSGSISGSRLNLFLYEVLVDGHLKNVALDEGQPTPLWLVLRYLLTAFDDQGDSDSAAAHNLIGEGMRALQDLNFLTNGLAALQDSPDLLKISFIDASVDLLSKIMQGTQEKYRCSVGFEIRPVMIASGEPPSYSLLVGVDYADGTIPGEKAIHNLVIPSLGPVISTVEPAQFEIGSDVEVTGTELGGPGLSVMLDEAELPVIAQRPDRLKCDVGAALAGGTIISAGSHPLTVVQTLPTGRRRSSNLLIGSLLPQLTTAVPSGITRTVPLDPTSPVTGTVALTGVLLGAADDDVFAALFRNGKVERVFDRFVRPLGPTPQTQMSFQIDANAAVPPDTYRVVLRVNGQQARNSPAVILVAP